MMRVLSSVRHSDVGRADHGRVSVPNDGPQNLEDLVDDGIVGFINKFPHVGDHGLIGFLP